MATICNMGAETGATTSIFPHSPFMTRYLHANHRPDMAQAIESISHDLRADEGAEYGQVIDIDLSTLEPHINGPFTPDLATPLSRFGQAVEKQKWPETLTAGLIGSCTNSSFEDLSRAAGIAQQAVAVGLTPTMPFLLSPDSLQTRETLEKSRTLQIFEEVGVKMLPNACCPCCGSWDRTDTPKVSFHPPTGDSLHGQGYLDSDAAYQAPPPGDRSELNIQIDPSSQRLQKLAPFALGPGKDFEDCIILIKTKGKCTTDHITTAGPWFRFRGHLENISNNTLIGAVNAENDKVNTVHNQLTQQEGYVPGTARHYQAQGHTWVVIGDHNYGEGSSREHAALQPRYLWGVAIIAKGFARIHEANLKKQGMLALTSANEPDYDRIRVSDVISIIGLAELAPGEALTLQVNPIVGKSWEAKLSHTFTPEQIEYFKAGSALNMMANGNEAVE